MIISTALINYVLIMILNIPWLMSTYKMKSYKITYVKFVRNAVKMGYGIKEAKYFLEHSGFTFTNYPYDRYIYNTKSTELEYNFLNIINFILNEQETSFNEVDYIVFSTPKLTNNDDTNT